jgi:hypothetical protein
MESQNHRFYMQAAAVVAAAAATNHHSTPTSYYTSKMGNTTNSGVIMANSYTHPHQSYMANASSSPSSSSLSPLMSSSPSFNSSCLNSSLSPTIKNGEQQHSTQAQHQTTEFNSAAAAAAAVCHLASLANVYASNQTPSTPSSSSTSSHSSTNHLSSTNVFSTQNQPAHFAYQNAYSQNSLNEPNNSAAYFSNPNQSLLHSTKLASNPHNHSNSYVHPNVAAYDYASYSNGQYQANGLSNCNTPQTNTAWWAKLQNPNMSNHYAGQQFYSGPSGQLDIFKSLNTNTTTNNSNSANNKSISSTSSSPNSSSSSLTCNLMESQLGSNQFLNACLPPTPTDESNQSLLSTRLLSTTNTKLNDAKYHKDAPNLTMLINSPIINQGKKSTTYSLFSKTI